MNKAYMLHAAIVIKQSELTKIHLCDMETNETQPTSFYPSFKAMKTLVNNPYDEQNKLWISPSNNVFSLHVRLPKNSKQWHITMFTPNGLTHVKMLYQRKLHYLTDILTPRIYNKMVQEAEMYDKGFIRCSQCREYIRRRSIAGGFYAGVYCESCWEGSVKERAACENYD